MSLTETHRRAGLPVHTPVVLLSGEDALMLSFSFPLFLPVFFVATFISFRMLLFCFGFYSVFVITAALYFSRIFRKRLCKGVVPEQIRQWFHSGTYYHSRKQGCM
jgi:hypothetical protein